MEIHVLKLKFLSLGLPLLLFSCASIQQISDDEVYKMQTPDIPLDANLLDETSYDTYKYRRDKKIESKSYYNEQERRNTLQTWRPLFPGSPFWALNAQVYLWSGYQWNTYNSPTHTFEFGHQAPRGKAVGFTAGTNFTKPNIVQHPNNFNVYGTNPVYIKPNTQTNRPSFKPEKGRSTDYGSKPGNTNVTNGHRSTPSTTTRTSPAAKPSVGISGGSSPRSTTASPKAGGRKF